VSTGTLVEGLKEKDVIFFDRHAGHSIRWKEKLYHVIQMQDVVLVE
jgi:co-chaperonin GroES (HSP10)